MERVNCVSDDIQKENPPAATSGLSQSEDGRPKIDSQEVDRAFHRILQCRYSVFAVINYDRLISSREWNESNICPGRRHALKRAVIDGYAVYNACFRSTTREEFLSLMEVDFKTFEDALNALGDNIGEPVHFWGRP